LHENSHFKTLMLQPPQNQATRVHTEYLLKFTACTYHLQQN